MELNRSLDEVYKNRFAGSEAARDQVWQVLTQYFQRWIRPTDSVLDLGAGYCEFINNIRAGRKFALDLNPVMPSRARADVSPICADVTQPWDVPSGSLNVIFTSNFFEHLPNKDALRHSLAESYRVLNSGGLLMALGPNIRFCYDVYWDYLDHFIPLSDRSLVEALELAGFRTERIIPRFLPFTMKGNLPPSPLLIRMYLSLPLAWNILGKQFLVLARKP